MTFYLKPDLLGAIPNSLLKRVQFRVLEFRVSMCEGITSCIQDVLCWKGCGHLTMSDLEPPFYCHVYPRAGVYSPPLTGRDPCPPASHICVMYDYILWRDTPNILSLLVV